MTKEQEEIINRLSKITNRQILYGNKCGITIEGFRELQEDIDTVLNRIKEKNAEIEKKDKIIDLMAEWISERCLYIDDYGNSCEIIQDSCNKKENCELCIKQYFERKYKSRSNRKHIRQSRIVRR